MAASTRLRQAHQVRNSETYDDQRTAGSGMESTPVNIEENLNDVRSQIRRIIDSSGNWYDIPASDIRSLVAGSVRYYGQALTGTIDGVNTVFTCATKFLHDGQFNEAMFYNGMRLFEGSSYDYVASESTPGGGYDTITFAVPPVVGDRLQIDVTPA